MNINQSTKRSRSQDRIALAAELRAKLTLLQSAAGADYARAQGASRLILMAQTEQQLLDVLAS